MFETMRMATLTRRTGKERTRGSSSGLSVLLALSVLLLKTCNSSSASLASEQTVEAPSEGGLSISPSTPGYASGNSLGREDEVAFYRTHRSDVAGQQSRLENLFYKVPFERGTVSIKMAFGGDPAVKVSRVAPTSTAASTVSSLSDSSLIRGSSRKRDTLRRRAASVRTKKKSRASPSSKWSRLGLTLASVFAMLGISNGINAVEFYRRGSPNRFRSAILSSLGYMASWLGLAGASAYYARPKKPPSKNSKRGWRIKRLLLGLLTTTVGVANWFRERQWIKQLPFSWRGRQREKNVATIEFMTWMALSSYLLYSSAPERDRSN